MIGAPSSTACELLAERVLGEGSPVSGAEAQAATALRVFDTLGALSAAARGTGAWPDEGELGADDGLLGTVGRLCAVTRSSEVDDIERRSCTTPGSAVVPVALALAAEFERAGGAPPGSTVLTAVAAGYEVMVAVGEAIAGPSVLYRGIWPSYLAAPLAAAATAGRLLALDGEGLVNALAIAAARVTGVAGRPPREPTARWFVFGCAAAEGLAAALAAEQGIVGDPGILEAVLRLQTSGAAVELSPPAETPAVTRVDVKPFCTSRQGQAATEAAQLAWADLGEPAVTEIQSIEVGVPEAYRAMIDQPHVQDRLTSITSAQFQIAAALDEPGLLFDVARAHPRLSDAGATLMEGVTVVADPDLTPMFPAVWPGRVTVRTHDRGEATRCVLEPDGARDRAPDWGWVVDKHRAIGSAGDQLPALAEMCQALDRDAAAPARDLLDLTLTCGPRTPRRHP